MSNFRVFFLRFSTIYQSFFMSHWWVFCVTHQKRTAKITASFESISWVVSWQSDSFRTNLSLSPNQLIVTGSDVIPDDVTRCWDYRRERPNFSRSVRFISLCIVIIFLITHRVTQRMWWNFMWLYLILFHFKWPHVTLFDLTWSQMIEKSLAK